MSLLNDALRDLERQKSPPQPSSGAGQSPAPKGNAQKAGVKSSRTQLFLPILAVVAVIYFLLVELNVLGLFDDKAESLVDVSPIQLNQEWLEKMEAAKKLKAQALEDVPGSATSNTSTVHSDAREGGQTPESTTSLQAKLEQMLLAIENKRLFAPAEHNAWHYRQSALALDPSNAVALDGKQEILEQLDHLIKSALLSGRTDKAQGYLAKLKSIPELAEVHRAYQDSLARSVVAKAVAAERLPDVSVNAEYRQIARPVESNGTPAVSNSKQAKSQTDASVARDVRTRPTRRVMAQAEKFLLEKSVGNETFAAVYQSYASQRNHQAMLSLAQRMGDRVPSHATFLKAHVLSASNPALAIDQLARLELPSSIDYLRQRRLAGLYQSQQLFGKAAPLYESLVSTPFAMTNDWLGLAVSQDKLGRLDQARLAYQQVLNLGHEDTRVLQFAQSRVNALSTQTEGAVP